MPGTAAHQASLSLTISQSLPKFISIALVMTSHPLMPSSPSALNLSQHQSLFQWVNYLCQVTKNIRASASASFLPMSIQGWFPLRFDWFDLLAVQGTLKSILQHHSSKASILWGLALFTVQLSQPYVTTGKTIALTTRTFVSGVISLLFNTLCRFVIAFLPRSNRLLISWLQSPSAVILQPKKIRSVTVSFVSASICHEVMGSDAWS